MFVNSVLTGLSPSHGLRTRDNSQTAKSAALAKELPEQPFTTEVDGAAQAPSVLGGDTTASSQLQNSLEEARRQNQATANRPTEETSDSPGGQSPPGIALYQRVSQYDNKEPSTSTLLKSWNDIMQGGQDEGGAVAAFAKTLSRDETLGFEPGILDLTA